MDVQLGSGYEDHPGVPRVPRVCLGKEKEVSFLELLSYLDGVQARVQDSQN